MVEQQSACNETRFIRALCPYCDVTGATKGVCEVHRGERADLNVENVIGALFGGGEANVEVRIIIHPRYLLPFTLYVALCPIEPWTELLVRWEPLFRARYQQWALSLQCINGWQLHKEIVLLQRALRDVEGKPHPATTFPPSISAGGYHQVCRPMRSVFERSGAVQVASVQYNEMDREVRASIQRKCEEQIRKRRVEDQEEAEGKESGAIGRSKRARVRARPKVAILSPSSDEVNRLALTEVFSCRHPVRFYTPPDHPAFAAVYTCSLDAGQPFALYPGVCRRDKEVQSGGPMELYSWELLKGQLQLDEKLVIQADRMGGPSRFINDAVFRRGGEDCINSTALAFINQQTRMPDLLIRTSRDVVAGEEIILSYGQRRTTPLLRATASRSRCPCPALMVCSPTLNCRCAVMAV